MTQSQKIRIKCTHCGVFLNIPYSMGIEAKSVCCPKCRNVGKFVDFLAAAQAHAAVQPAAVTAPAPGTQPGVLIDRSTGVKVRLNPGRNVVGRKAASSKADCQLTCDDLRLSREHLVINATRGDDGVYTHTIALFKPSVNDSFLNSVRLSYGVATPLRNYDSIAVPGLKLRFRSDI